MAEPTAWVNEVVKAHPPREDRYLWLRDLGQIPEHPRALRDLYDRIEAHERSLERFRPNGMRYNTELSFLVVAPDGTIPDHVLEVLEREGEDLAKLRVLLQQHSKAMAALKSRLGLTSSTPNPTVQGRTWLCTWPVTRPAGDDGTVLRTEAAMVVAGPRDVLLPGATLLLTSAWDLENPDRDQFATQLQGNSILLNEAQRRAWGSSMHQVNRVYWSVLPDDGEPPRQKQGRRKKAAAEPPEE